MLVITAIPSLFLIIGLFLAVKLIHKKSFRFIITSRREILISKLLIGFFIHILIMTCIFIIEYVINPNGIEYVLDLNAFLKILPLVFLLVPLQTTAEELFFRGYLIRVVGKFTQNIILISVVIGIIFVIPHLLNPELKESFITLIMYFFIIGFFWTYISIKTESIELAIGSHAANNLFLALIISYSDSGYNMIPSILTLEERFSPLLTLTLLVVLTIVAYTVYLYKKGK